MSLNKLPWILPREVTFFGPEGPRFLPEQEESSHYLQLLRIQAVCVALWDENKRLREELAKAKNGPLL